MSKLNKSLKVLFLINGIFVLAGNMLGPLFAVFVESRGGGIAAVSGTWSAMLLTTTLINFILIKFGDRIRKHKYYLLAGFVLRSLAWFLFIFATSLEMIIIIQIIVGLGEALGSTGFDSLISEHLDRNHHIKDFAVWKTFANILSAFAVFVGGLVVVNFGFTSLFAIMSAIAALCAVVTFLLPRKLL